VLAGILLVLVTGSLAFCVLAVVAAVRYRALRPAPLGPAAWDGAPPISILKPLAGAEEGLEENLRSFFEQRYGVFEILLAVRSPQDAAIPIVERLRARYPAVPSRLIVTGEPPYPNAKVYSLDRMLDAARYRLVVMADSDTRVTPELLATLAAEFQDPKLALATCPYRAVPGSTFWSTLEALGLNTEFAGGVLVARMLDGMKFALGPTIAARREALEGIGGLEAVKDYLAEDYVLGKLVAGRGMRVILSSYVIEHRIGAQGFGANLRHRLRWNRSTRRSRPWGYVGQLFTHPLALALLLWAVHPGWWPVAPVAAFFRAAAGWATAIHALDDPLTRRLWWLGPVQDVASFLVWVAGFFGNTILWRGRKYALLRDGRFEVVEGK
jgi:ceramide glucosyltransferase